VKNLQVGITTTGGLNVKLIDKVEVGVQLRKYKHKNNSTNFPELFNIPVDQRITAMAARNFGETIKTIAVALTLAFETMNLSRPMQAFQILDLAEAIVDEAESDKLSIEDLMIFLQRMTRGEYQGLYEGIDIPKFMERFNQYRDERWDAGIELRDKRHEEYKSLGDRNVYERENPKDASTLGLQLEHFRKQSQIRTDEHKSRRQ